MNERKIKECLRFMRAAHKRLSLAETYLGDGAPLDAARCAVEAAALLFKASQAKQNAMQEG